LEGLQQAAKDLLVETVALLNLHLCLAAVAAAQTRLETQT
jgi:hypothetical protein